MNNFNICFIFFSNVLPKKTHFKSKRAAEAAGVFLLSTCRVEAVESLDQRVLQDPQENRCILVLGFQLQADSSQQQAVEVLPVQQQIHVLQEESFTEPAELRSSMTLQIKKTGAIYLYESEEKKAV